MAFLIKKCEHFDVVSKIKKPELYECEACVKSGDSWVHLRTCQSCGVTLCCDSSVNQHASKHANKENHPVVISAEPNEKWMWCYVHNIINKY